MIHVPWRAASWQIASIVAASKQAPVGLFGLQMSSSFVRGVNSARRASMSGRQRPPVSRSGHARTGPANAFAIPQVCM
jgi:hypothetical protein